MKIFKKISWSAYLMIMALLVMSLSGCGSSSNSSFYYNNNKNYSEIVGIASPSFQKGQSYMVYKGGGLTINSNPKVYVAPLAIPEANQAAMNLGLSKSLTNESIIITDTNGTVVFAYNPAGSGTDFTSTNVGINGGTRMQYNSLTFNTSSTNSVNANASALTYTGSVIDITLNGSSATEGSTTIPVNDYVWHADPKHAEEYWTEGINGTTEYTKKQYLAAVNTTSNGLYIAHDIRYTNSDLEFTTSQTATKDGEAEYVVYYDESSTAVANAIAEIVSEKGSNFGGKYIFATLPSQVAGMGGGMPGGNNGTFPGGNDNNGNIPTPPDGNNNGGGTPPNMPSVTTAADSSITAYSTMTHSASDAYSNPVLHITKAGTYRLTGTWNGQIWIDTEDDDDEDSKVTIILNGVTVTCTVAPALVFHDVYECGPDDEDEAASDWKTLGTNTVLNNAGARVIINDGTTNNFTGANVYRILKLEPKSSATKVDGTDIGNQKKLYKMDGTFYSFVSMVIGAQSSTASGTLNITSSTFEGLDAELHMLIESGKITVTAPDDGINVNEDDISVFTMNGGNLTISSTGGDGIDSNGYVAFNGGTLNITAGSSKQNSAGEAGIDAEKGVYIYDDSAYTWTASSGNNGGDNGNITPPDNNNSGEDGNTTPPNNGSGDITPPDNGNGDTTPPDNGNNTISTGYIDFDTNTGNGELKVYFNDTLIDDNDDPTLPRTVATSGTVFKLETNRTVNDFSAITEVSQ